MAALGDNPEDPPAAKVEKEAKEEPAPQEKPAPAPETKEEKKAEKKKADTETVTIRATGTPGTAFSGNYLVGGSPRSVDGVTPQDFEVEVQSGFLSADIVSVTFQKRDPGAGELAVQLVDEGGEVLKEQNTTAEFGVVSLTLAPNERQ